MKFSILHTSARPHAWRESYGAWISRALDPESVEYILCADERWGFEDQALQAWRELRPEKNLTVWNTARKCMVDGYAEAAKAATGRILILNSDDMECPLEWDRLLWDLMPMWPEFVLHVSTGWYDGEKASSIQILSRSRYEKLGYVMHPGYLSMYADDDFLHHAYADGVVIDARHLMFPHKHAAPGAWDEVYLHQNSGEAGTVGKALFERRKAEGFK